MQMPVPTMVRLPEAAIRILDDGFTLSRYIAYVIVPPNMAIKSANHQGADERLTLSLFDMASLFLTDHIPFRPHSKSK